MASPEGRAVGNAPDTASGGAASAPAAGGVSEGIEGRGVPWEGRGERRPTMADIHEVASEKGVRLKVDKIGPLFRISATTLEGRLLGRAEGGIRPWLGGNVLHLDSVKMKKAEPGSTRSVFGVALLLGAAAIRLGHSSGCEMAELLAINDTDEYHAKLKNYYSRVGFKVVHEVTGEELSDLPHMLVWGGVGTKMEARIVDLLIKWERSFTPKFLL